MFTTSISFQLKHNYGKTNCPLIPLHSNILLFFFTVLVIASAIPITTCFDQSSFLIKKNNSFDFHHSVNSSHTSHVQFVSLVNLTSTYEFEADFDEILLKRTSDRDMIMIGRVSSSSTIKGTHGESSQILLISDNANSSPRYSKLSPSKMLSENKSDKDTRNISQIDQIYTNSLFPNCFVATDASKSVIYTSCQKSGFNESPQALLEKPINFKPDFLKLINSSCLLALSTVPNSSQLSMWLSTNFGDSWTNTVQNGIHKLPYQSISDSIKFFENRAYFLRMNQTTLEKELIMFDMNATEMVTIDTNVLAFDLHMENFVYLKNDTTEVFFQHINLKSNHKFVQHLDSRVYPKFFGKCLDFKFVITSVEPSKTEFGVILVQETRYNAQRSDLIIYKEGDHKAKFQCKNILASNSAHRNIGIQVVKEHSYYLLNTQQEDHNVETKYTKSSELRIFCRSVHSTTESDEPRNIYLDHFMNLNKLEDRSISSVNLLSDGILLASKLNKKNQIEGIYYNLYDELEWHRLLHGHYFYEYSNMNRTIIAAEGIKPTNQLIFTADHGKSWLSLKFSEKALQVKGLVYFNNTNTIAIFCHDDETSKWIIHEINLNRSFNEKDTNAGEDNGDVKGGDDDDDDDDDDDETTTQLSTSSTAPADNRDSVPLDEKISTIFNSNKKTIIAGLSVALVFSIVLIIVMFACRTKRNKSLAKHLELFKFYRAQRRENGLWRRRFQYSLSLNCFSKVKSSPPNVLVPNNLHSSQAGLIESSVGRNNLAYLGSSQRTLTSLHEVPTSLNQHHPNPNLNRFHSVSEDYHPLI